MLVSPLLAAVLLGVPVQDGPPSRESGTVVDAAGAPVAGAAVGLLSAAGPEFLTETAADGTFALPWTDGPWSSFARRVVARGPGADGRLGVVREDELMKSRRLTVRLLPPHELAVTVRTPAGEPAAGAAVYAVTWGGGLTTAPAGPGGVAALRFPAEAHGLRIYAVAPGVGFAAVSPESGRGLPRRLDLALAPAFTHRVRCVAPDPETGADRPVAGATVTVRQLSRLGGVTELLRDVPFAAATTDADGVATLDWLPRDFERRIYVAVTAPGFSDASADIGGPAAGPVPVERTVRLERPATLAGRVTRPGGAPIAGVRVLAEGEFSRDGGIDRERAEARTGPDGLYEMTVRGDAGYIVTAEPPDGLAPTPLGTDAALFVPPGGRRDDANFPLTPGTLLTGRVLRGGEPLPDWTVSLTAYGTFPDARRHPGALNWGHGPTISRGVTTDADGRYAFRVGPGRYTFWAQNGMIADVKVFTVTAGEDRRERDLAVKPDVIVYAGTVTDDLGLPLAGLTVAVADTPGAALAGRGGISGVTAADGTFRLERRGQTGSWATVTASGVDPARGPVLGAVRVKSEEEPTTALTVPVAPPVTLTGRATDDRGTPLAGVPVAAEWAGISMGFDGPPFEVSAVTGPNGRYALPGLVSGREYRLGVDLPTAPRSRASLTDVTPAATGTHDAGAASIRGRDAASLTAAARRGFAFAEPADEPAALAAHRRAAAALDRPALVLRADPASAAGRDLFAAVYDDPALAERAAAAFLTRCLPAAAGEPATLTVHAADGSPAGPYTHAAGDRAGVAAFLEANGGGSRR